MKSIKQQYIDLREGNMTQANFMRNLRMTLPQYVTNVTSFDDSVRILKNKGILTEADTKSSEEGKWKTVTGKDLYGHFNELDNLNGHEVMQGIDWEMQCNPELTKLEAQKIVIKKLKKNPYYYTAWDMSGIEGYEAEYLGGKSADPKAHQMKPVKGNDMVDKTRGMKPVKDVEKVKKDADAKKETNSGVKGVSSMSLIAKAIRGLKKMDATGEKMKKISVKENYNVFSSERRGEEIAAAEASESHNGFKRKDIVTIDSELAKKLGIEAGETFTVKNFIVHNEGSLLQNVDAILIDKDGDKVQINVEYLEAVLNENVANTIFNKNANITASVNKMGKDDDYVKNYNAKAQAADAEQAKKDAEKNKKDTETQLKAAKGDTMDMALANFPGLRERLKELIRKELKEITGADGGDAMDDEDGSSYINNND
jgi:hypothetical protein